MAFPRWTGTAWRPWLAGLMALLFLACVAPPPPEAPQFQGPHASKQYLQQILQREYLWSDQLPEANPADYPDPQAMLRDLTQRASGGRDRWSQLRPRGGPGACASGPGLDFGLRWLVRGGQARVAEVLPGTSAARAGIRRGDRILAIAGSPGGLDRGSTSGRDPAETAPESAGGRAWFRLQRPATGATFDAELVLAETAPDPVPDAAAPPILAAGGRRVGYLQLREFIPAARLQVRQAVDHFRRNGVTDLIVDLRYNPGGDLATLEVLGNLLGGAAGPGEVMFTRNGNPQNSGAIIRFLPEPGALAPGRLAFIVTRASCSASEALVNALLPYYPGSLALVGQRTHGKPVGCITVDLPGSSLELHLVACRLLNAHGRGDYFGGLPDPGFPGATCAAEDDLDHAPGDPAEASTAAALRWIQDGTSEGPIPAG